MNTSPDRIKCGCTGFFHSTACSDQNPLDPFGSILLPEHRERVRTMLMWARIQSPPVDGVFEMDGPPQAYFEMTVMDPETGREHMGRFVYRSLRVQSSSEGNVRQWMATALSEIRKVCQEKDAFIIWRKRPRFEYLDDLVHVTYPTEAEIDAGVPDEPTETTKLPAVWRGFARLTTNIPLPEELWAQFETKQYESAHTC